jgi:hypothetical protein
LIGSAVTEAVSIYRELGGREPGIRDKTAAAAFMAQFYGGLENIFKRIHRFYGVPVPTGDSWHIDLFRRFCNPADTTLPTLFDEQMALALAPYRAFRHVVYHSYGFQLEWDRMREGLASLDSVYSRLQAILSDFLASLQDR